MRTVLPGVEAGGGSVTRQLTFVAGQGLLLDRESAPRTGQDLLLDRESAPGVLVLLVNAEKHCLIFDSFRT